MNFLLKKMFIIISVNLALIVFANESNDKSIDLTQSTTSVLAAIGRIAKIGDYYDSKTDTFPGTSIFKKGIPQTFIRSTEKSSTDITYERSNTVEEKLSTVQLSASLSLRILSGSIQLQGSGKFFKDYKKSAKTASASIVGKLTTFYEDIIIKDEDLIKYIDLDMLERREATHIVRGITWGGNVFLKVEETANDEKDAIDLQGKLSATIQGIYAGVAAEVDGKVSQTEFTGVNKFHYELFGDISPEEVPQTFIDALKVIKNSPSLVKSANGGKGVPVSYELQPTYSLCKDLQTNIKLNSIVKQINEITVQNSIQFYDEILLKLQRFNDLSNDVNKYEIYICSAKVRQFNQLFNEFSGYRTRVQTTLRDTLNDVMSSNVSANKLDNYLVEAGNEQISVKNLNETIIESMKNDISFIQTLEKLNLTLFNKNTIIDHFLIENPNKNIYLLFYKKNSPSGNSILFEFKRWVKESETVNDEIFAFIDYEIMNAINRNYFYSNETSKIVVFNQGQLLIEYDNHRNNSADPNDPDSWSLPYMKRKVSLLIKCPIPIGANYIQNGMTRSPEIMWPMVCWKGLFHFTQPVSTPSITGQEDQFTIWERILCEGESD